MPRELIDLRQRERTARDRNIFCRAMCGNLKCPYNFALCEKGTRIDDVRWMNRTVKCMGRRTPG